MKVYVISKNGKPLMPTKPSRARKMLRDGKAKVVKRTPFTIQLLVEAKEYTQPITLGVDAGSKTVGISATTEKEELYSSEVILRNDIVDLLHDRSTLRRNRRSRKTRYRKARFLNRKVKRGWLAPSVEHKINSHLKIIANAHKILPISKIIVETASFDIQKILNPDIKGKEYQQGEQLGFQNVRHYVLFRDKYECRHCKAKNVELEVHHIIQRKDGGGDRPENLIALCKTCHKNHHNRTKVLELKRPKQFRDAAFMGIMRNTLFQRLCDLYENVEETYGYITKHTRMNCNLTKGHRIDAFCITENVNAKLSDTWFLQKFVRKNNRKLHMQTINKSGYRKDSQAAKYVFGFQLFDKVLYDNQECFIFGRRTRGSFDIRILSGETISGNKTYKKLRKLESRKSLLTESKVV